MIAATGLEIGSWVAAILVAVGVVIGWVTGALRRAFEWFGARIAQVSGLAGIFGRMTAQAQSLASRGIAV